MAKVVKYIKKSIELNHNGDMFHRNELIHTCDHLIEELKKAKSINDINVYLIQELIRLIFTLLGTMPHHWNRKNPYFDSSWSLSGHRTLNYIQDADQKAHLIIYLVDIGKKYTIDFETFGDMHGIYYRKFMGKSSDFVVWFKKIYSGIYCDIF